MGKTALGYIVVEGPIGVGKTTLAKRLATTFDNDLLLERSAENPFLSRLYRNPGSTALPAQLHFLFEHVGQIKTLRQADLFKANQVADFLVQGNKLFAEATLGQDELDLYYQIYNTLLMGAPVPDLVIYLQASVDVLIKRIRSRLTDYGEKIEKDYLQKISDAYINFFYHYDASPLLIVNTTDLDFTGDHGDYDLLLDYLSDLSPGRHYFNPQQL